MIHDTLIIGAGMAGLACAQMLAAQGRGALILDKGRGIGGRMAARRVQLGEAAVTFDHGAQFLAPRAAEFARFLEGLPDAAAPWAGSDSTDARVGLPGMSGLPRAMAATLPEGQTPRQGVEVTALARESSAWRVATTAGKFQATRVILTLPAPQVTALIGADHPLAAPLAAVRMAPCLTLMAAFAPETPRPFLSRRLESSPLGWIAQDSSKPGRADHLTTWVAQAKADWSAEHLELPPAEIAARMLPLLCAEIGADPALARHVSAHRWRYAQCSAPLGQPFLRSDDGSLLMGGDWCLGPHAEDAWISGRAMAQDLLGQSHVA